MDGFKEKPGLRVGLIVVCFAGALAAVWEGWKMTGQMAGLLLMIAGVGLLLVALAVYNKPFKESRKK